MSPSAQVYRHEQLGYSAPRAFIDHFYTDDLYTALSVERVERFFVWLGVLTPTEQSHTLPPSDAPRQTAAASGSPQAAEATAAAAAAAAAEEDGEPEVPPEILRAQQQVVEIGAQIQLATVARDMSRIGELMEERNAAQAELRRLRAEHNA